MIELIKITEKDGKKAVSARDLHQFLESKQDFTNWIKGRIKKYALIENHDFIFELWDLKLNKVIEPINKMINGSYKTEFILSMDAAKEVTKDFLHSTREPKIEIIEGFMIDKNEQIKFIQRNGN